MIHVQHSHTLPISSLSTATTPPTFIATCIGCFVLTPLPRMYNTLEQFHIHKLYAPTSFYTDKTRLSIFIPGCCNVDCVCMLHPSFSPIYNLQPSHNITYILIIICVVRCFPDIRNRPPTNKTIDCYHIEYYYIVSPTVVTYFITYYGHAESAFITSCDVI
jgi:hypothetical protein